MGDTCAAMVGQLPADDLIARGNTSDVWRWSPTTVVKVLRPEIPAQWAALEADITQRVHAAGLPAPATDGLVEVDGRPGVVLERVDGASMWSRMKAEPAMLPTLVEELVGLQATIQAAGPIGGLPDLVARLHGKIDEAAQVSDAERLEAHELLTGMPGGDALCHGDMHPANILLSRRGWIVVDWFDAAIGHRDADLARSSLLMRPPATARSADRHLDGATVEVLDRLHGAYLAALRRRGLIEPFGFARWEAVLAVARMSEPVQKADLLSIWRRWRTDHNALPA
jgi:aminoglycoside phosphotransferase (APT) family kinase protein